MEAWKSGRSAFAPPTILRRENMDVKFLGFTGLNSAYRLDRDLTDLQLQQERPRRNCSFKFHSLRTWKIIAFCAKNLSHWVFSDFFSEVGLTIASRKMRVVEMTVWALLRQEKALHKKTLCVLESFPVYS